MASPPNWPNMDYIIAAARKIERDTDHASYAAGESRR